MAAAAAAAAAAAMVAAVAGSIMALSAAATSQMTGTSSPTACRWQGKAAVAVSQLSRSSTTTTGEVSFLAKPLRRGAWDLVGHLVRVVRSFAASCGVLTKLRRGGRTEVHRAAPGARLPPAAAGVQVCECSGMEICLLDSE